MLVTKAKLYTHTLKDMRSFYQDILGLKIRTSHDDSFQVEIGKSILEFQDVQDGTKPFYHFAINIPGKLFKDAKKWAKEKVTLNTENGMDEVYFEFLDANSLYFMDPSGNIVELIARSSEFAKKDTFSTEEFISIGEINITTNEIHKVGSQLMELGIQVRAGKPLRNDGKLNFLGELEGDSFLLLGPENRTWFFSDKQSEIHPLSVQIEHRIEIDVDSNGGIQTRIIR